MAITYEVSTEYYGGFMRFDSGGNMNLMKLLAFTNQSTQFLFFHAMFIYHINTSDVVLIGRTLSSNRISNLQDQEISTLSYSEDSSTDWILFRIDNNGNTVWTTVIDYQLGYDSASKIITYDSIVYGGMYANAFFPCFFSLNGSDGHYLQSNCFTFNSYDANDNKGIIFN